MNISLTGCTYIFLPADVNSDFSISRIVLTILERTNVQESKVNYCFDFCCTVLCLEPSQNPFQ